MKRSKHVFWTTLAALQVLLSVSCLAADAPPVAAVRPVTDTYFGTPVVDSYRYLEDLKNPEVQGFMKAQASYTRAVLDAVPGRAALLDRIHALSNGTVRRFEHVRRGQRYFFLKTEPGSEQPSLYYRDSLQGEEHLLLAPSEMGRGTSTHFALDFYSPSWDGRLVVYGLSSGGSEVSVLHVMDVATATSLPEAIDRTSDSIVSWRPDNRSFFYMRYVKPTPETPPSETEYNARTYLHVVGKSIDGNADAVVFGRGVSKSVEVPEGQGTYVILSAGSPYALAIANRNMDFAPATIFYAPLAEVSGPNTRWRKLAATSDGVTAYRLHGEKLYFLSQKGAPRFRLLATSLKKPDLGNSEVVVAESSSVITDFDLAREGIYVRLLDGATSHLVRVSLDGKVVSPVTLPFKGNVFAAITDPAEAGALFNVQSWTHAPELVAYDAATDSATDTGFIAPSKVDTSMLESKEIEVTSYDGTQVPLSLVYKKGMVLDGSHPTIVEGYGSYGISLESYFSDINVAWIERGGIIAVAHVRGGGELGEDWHRGGQLLVKMNTVFDFVACGQYLVDHHYTSSKYLAANGGSAGGITVGRTFTLRPDLYSVILDQVGMSDSLRFETEPNGPPNVPEFGSTKTEAGFHGLYAMSPYVHIRDGEHYPAIMFLTGANDPRVAPWHMTKMAARTQAATSSQRPVLLRIDYDAGHGMGSNRSQRETELADMWSFALWQMGDPAFQPVAKQ